MNDDDQEQNSGPRPGRVNFRRSARYPGGSWGSVRSDVLAALGVLKVATYRQLHALVAADQDDRSHQSVEHVASAARDLEKHKLVEGRGTTTPPGRSRQLARHPGTAPAPAPGGPGAEKIVGLTPLGLAAAVETLGDDRIMGGHARGAGRTGAPHAMLVNEAIIIAVTGTTTHDAPPPAKPHHAPPRRPLPCGPLGTIDSWTTEAPHTIVGRQSVIPDAVLRAPEIGVPVLFLEMDRGTMTDPATVAAKLDNYHRYFERTVRDSDRDERFAFELAYTPAPRPYGWASGYEVPRPPVAFIFDQGTKNSRPRRSPEALLDRLHTIGRLTSHHWSGTHRQSEGVEYLELSGGQFPILATTMDRLREHGFLGPTWLRYGRTTWQTLTDALNDTPDWDLISERREAREAKEDADLKAAEKAKWDAAAAKLRTELLAARAANDQMHPCHTCEGPLGGEHDSDKEMGQPAHPDRLECPSCEDQRRAAKREPIILELPTARALRRAQKHGPPKDDPWWAVRLLHEKRWPKYSRTSGETPYSMSQIPHGRSLPEKY